MSWLINMFWRIPFPLRLFVAVFGVAYATSFTLRQLGISYELARSVVIVSVATFVAVILLAVERRHRSRHRSCR